MGWTMPLQHAAFRGVRFDVLNITDTFERAFVEHAYPFVNGADLEDMGLQPRQVQLQAVFFGKGYRIGLDKFIQAIQQSGVDVLVHPIFGRMPNMLCASASIRHGDEFVDYVTLDLTFIEATPLNPIFTLEQGLWSEIDRIMNELEAFEDSVIALYGQFMHVIASVEYAKSRLLRVWSGLVGIYESTASMLGLDTQKYAIPISISLPHFEQQSVQAIKDVSKMISQGLISLIQPAQAIASLDKDNAYTARLFHEAPLNESLVFTARTRFDDILSEVNRLKQLPDELVSGKNDSVTRASRLAALASTFSYTDIEESRCAVHLISTKTLIYIGITLIELYAETLLPTDIEHIAQHIRLAILDTIDVIRQLQQQDLTLKGNAAQQNTGVYTQTYQVVEQLRQLAHRTTQIALAAINRKPPLMIKVSPLTGTIQQIAHQLYGDYTRAHELLRLNPQIKQPNFIQQGTLINAYSK